MSSAVVIDHTQRDPWDVATEHNVRTFPGHAAPVHGVAFTPDGAEIVSAGADHNVGRKQFD